MSHNCLSETRLPLVAKCVMRITQIAFAFNYHARAMSQEGSLSDFIGVTKKVLTRCTSSRNFYPFCRTDKDVVDRALIHRYNEPQPCDVNPTDPVYRHKYICR